MFQLNINIKLRFLNLNVFLDRERTKYDHLSNYLNCSHFEIIIKCLKIILYCSTELNYPPEFLEDQLRGVPCQPTLLCISMRELRTEIPQPPHPIIPYSKIDWTSAIYQLSSISPNKRQPSVV